MSDLGKDTPKQEFLPLAEVTSNYKPAYRDSWEEWWNDEPHATSELIDRLCEELRQNGSFERPVILCAEETEFDEVLGQEDYYPAVIGDGMHRLAAHHRTGIDPVFVQHGYTPGTEKDWLDPTLMVILTRLPEGEFEIYDELVETLSWRHEGETHSTWFTVEFGSGHGDIEELWLAGGDPTRDSISAIYEDVKSRVGNLVEVVDVKWQYFNEEGDEIDYVHPEQVP